jgi:acetoin utilization deacetylase AcuC-like enzyme
VAGRGEDGLCRRRPPGHHADGNRPRDGVLPVRHRAIGAKRALDHHGLSRVAIVDFDVHHGNGTQDLLWDEGRCLFASSHQMPLYPGTGRRRRRARMARCERALRGGSDGAAMRQAYERLILPAVATGSRNCC